MARRNPDNTLWIGAGVLTVSGLGWTAYRLQQRAKLKNRLLESSSVQKAREWVSRNPVAPSDNWLLTPEGIAEKAANEVPIFGTDSVDAAYIRILNSLPKKDLSLAEKTADLSEAGQTLYESTRSLWNWAWGGIAPTPIGDPSMSWGDFLE